MNEMTNQQLANTLRTASQSVKENIALAFLLLLAAERIETFEDNQ